MKNLVLILSLLALPSLANAYCYGSERLYSCSDSNGNNYDVQKIGNLTYVNGYNRNTGSSWSSESQTIGNITYQNGRAANGNSWNQTIQRIGNSTYYSGMDGNDNYQSQTCDSYGCY
ncbi:hypothetical protein SAMN02745664_10460 [Moraxella cuniculi DSM 21768]|uniref:DUF4124 domain-containing protein n=1 Tax=Moraxella cuniculi DSM 21768 TaxID=1122245 RepID=A0A1N7EDE0_9GAMM|nr:hypothetical protein [Moraxella cuniculi]OOS05342.1 hypothetical protein B0189_06970 [Moraxella cuniculi]SIR85935.1 hypothetical protein SAMN02745664_10460 [Moraxella cuniculi DSM 21768]